MLDNLTNRLSRVVKTLRGEARLTEANMADMLREVRMALLEADVALPVVRELTARIKEKAQGSEVQGSLTPGQALVGVVNRELGAIMGGDESALNFSTTPPAVILLAGLQGAGKTTTAGKLAKFIREQHKKKVLTVSVDIYRPAAIKQLETVTAQAGVDFFASDISQKPVEIALSAIAWARTHYHDVLIIDTAGRLGIDAAMMEEIRALRAELVAAADTEQALRQEVRSLRRDLAARDKRFGWLERVSEAQRSATEAAERERDALARQLTELQAHARVAVSGTRPLAAPSPASPAPSLAERCRQEREQRQLGVFPAIAVHHRAGRLEVGDVELLDQREVRDAALRFGHVLGDLATQADHFRRLVGAARGRSRDAAAVVEQIGIEVRMADAPGGGLDLREVDAEVARALADGGGGQGLLCPGPA